MDPVQMQLSLVRLAACFLLFMTTNSDTFVVSGYVYIRCRGESTC